MKSSGDQRRKTKNETADDSPDWNDAYERSTGGQPRPGVRRRERENFAGNRRTARIADPPLRPIFQRPFPIRRRAEDLDLSSNPVHQKGAPELSVPGKCSHAVLRFEGGVKARLEGVSLMNTRKRLFHRAQAGNVEKMSGLFHDSAK